MNTPRPNHTKRLGREHKPLPPLPLFDRHRGNNPPKLIGWYSPTAGILTENHNPSMPSRVKGIHEQRVRAVKEIIAKEAS